jgi:hypothetical protein
MFRPERATDQIANLAPMLTKGNEEFGICLAII